MANKYDVERSWPDYFLEHRRETVEKQGTYRAGSLPVWTVHCPLGYLGNSIIIEGDDGLIVYDTGVNVEAGEHIAAEIKKVASKPVVAVFYSHHHGDHYNGTTAIVDSESVADGALPIYAWENFETERANEFGEIAVRQAMGVAYYGGAFLPPEEEHHHGIGTLPAGGGAGYIPPTETFSENVQLTISGVTMNVFYTGGEAISEFGIHIPEFDMVIIADEFFTGIPNLHSIRGSKPRIPDNYLAALDRVLEISPEWLLGSHIMPIEGKDYIAETVTRYRDATQYLWDQSVRLINKGLTPVELQHALKDLPPHLYEPPYSVPMYGTPFTSVPEFFTGWVSWFSGDATDLLPSEPRHKATNFVSLMGGAQAVLEAAKRAHADGDHQLAAELASLVVQAEPDVGDARLVKAAALRARGYEELNPIARSWYLTGALELEGAIDADAIAGAMLGMLISVQSIEEVASTWRYQLDAAEAGAEHLVVSILDPESGDTITARLRNSVLVVTGGLDDGADVTVEATPERLASDPAAATVTQGNASDYQRFIGLLDRDLSGFGMHAR